MVPNKTPKAHVIGKMEGAVKGEVSRHHSIDCINGLVVFLNTGFHVAKVRGIFPLTFTFLILFVKIVIQYCALLINTALSTQEMWKCW